MNNLYLEIKHFLLEQDSKDPIKLFTYIVKNFDIVMHGVIHHFLDGAVVLTCYSNIVEGYDLNAALDLLYTRTKTIAGASCGFMGVCGAVSSIGSANAIIFGTSYDSDTKEYKNNMKYTSSVLQHMSLIGGPRCCKRNAYVALEEEIKFMDQFYNIKFDKSEVEKCSFVKRNKECIYKRCPYF